MTSVLSSGKERKYSVKALPVGYPDLQKTFRDADLVYFLYRENYKV